MKYSTIFIMLNYLRILFGMEPDYQECCFFRIKPFIEFCAPFSFPMCVHSFVSTSHLLLARYRQSVSKAESPMTVISTHLSFYNNELPEISEKVKLSEYCPGSP